MFGFHEKIIAAEKELLQPHIIFTKVFCSKLRNLGITLNQTQEDALSSQFKSYKEVSVKLNIDFSDEQLSEAGYCSEEELRPDLEAIIKNLPEFIENFADNFSENRLDLYIEVVEEMSGLIYKDLKSRMKDMIDDQLTLRSDYEKSIDKSWGSALDLLQGLIVIADEVTENYMKRTDEEFKNDKVQQIIIPIQAKINQISKEILLLLRNGFADGAQARWRSLHELSVIVDFIAQNGEDIAERYILHEAIESYKSAKIHNEYCHRLGSTVISNPDMFNLKKEHDNLISKYGNDYRSDYGWAANVLKKPSFRDIEKSVNLDFSRPHYKEASTNIHGNASGVLNRLGLRPENNALLAGASNIGLSNPGQSTVIFLTHSLEVLLSYNTNLDCLAISKAIVMYSSKVESKFLEIEQKLI